MEEKRPDYANGKICYVIIPSRDTEASASFFEKTVNWRIRRDNHGSLSFDDGVGQVSGMWVTGLKPHRDSDLRIHIMVADIAATVEKIKAAGGTIVQDFDPNASEVTAEFTDLDGNIWGLYQERALAGK
jgi:predicted enzyme related to lactoylglutathione lyase